jgi:hypothetical protein
MFGIGERDFLASIKFCLRQFCDPLRGKRYEGQSLYKSSSRIPRVIPYCCRDLLIVSARNSTESHTTEPKFWNRCAQIAPPERISPQDQRSIGLAQVLQMLNQPIHGRFGSFKRRFLRHLRSCTFSQTTVKRIKGGNVTPDYPK